MLRGLAQIGAAACVASVLAVAVSGEQAVAKIAATPTVVHGTAQIVHGVRVDLAELVLGSAATGARESAPHVPFVPGDRATRVDPQFGSVEALASTAAAGPLVPSPSATGFQALPDANTSIPPDTHGAVGPNDVLTSLNTEVRVQNKAGAVQSTVTLDSFWSGLMPAPDSFDPKVVYDPLAGRFVFTAMADARSPSSRVLIGVSDTSSAVGSWHLFGVDADASNADWADFPSIGFDGSRVVVTVNMFDVDFDDFDGARMFVFDKGELYDNDSVLAVTRLNDPDGPFGGFTMSPASTLDPGETTTYLVEDWGVDGLLRLSTITGTAPNEVLTTGVAFPQLPAPWAFRAAGGADFAPQLGTAQKIQTNDSRIGNCVLRGGSIWCTHTVFPQSGPARSAVQWFELSTVGAVRQVGRVDDASGGLFYAFPSIAVNATNDVLIGYSRFGAGQFASANYAYRTCGDPLGTMRDDTVLKAGEGPYWKTFSGTRNRWGDYSHTVVDPSDNSTMWTIQEYAATPVGFPAANSGRWGTWWGRVPAPSGRPAPTNPAVSSASHSSSSWRSDPTVDVNWSGAVSGCGIDGYSFSFTLGASDAPDTIKDVGANVTSATSPAFSNGQVYFHLRTLDRVGTWSDPIHAGPFLIDTQAPVDPVLSSSSHTVGVASPTKIVRVAWQGARDGPSGVDGFSFSWDTSATSVPDDIKDAEETVTGTASPSLAPGRYWFHLRTRDNAGNWTSTVHLGPFVITRPVVRRCVVPNVKGKTLAKAKAALKARGCATGKVKRAFSGKVKKGRVIQQSKRAGSRHPVKTKVGLTVSKGKRKK
jgi:PASTA domain